MDSEDLLLSDKSPLNTPDDNEQPGCSKSNLNEMNSASNPEDDMTSCQPPRVTSEKTAKHQRNRVERKRKAEAENLYSLKTEIKRTKESIKKLTKHLDNKTCPKSLCYSALANIPPGEKFKKDIQVVKQKVEQGFLSVLTKFNYRCLERQKTKLRKLKGKTLRNDNSVKA